MRFVWAALAVAMAAYAANLRDQIHHKGLIKQTTFGSDVDLPPTPVSQVETEDKHYTHICDHPEGTPQKINERSYYTYCWNGRCYGYSQLPGSNLTWEECEKTYNQYATALHAPPYYGFNWYPQEGTCFLFYINNSRVHYYERQIFEKIFAYPVSQPYEEAICPLLKGEGEVREIDGELYRFFCRGQARVEDANKNVTTDVSFDECAKRFEREGGELFHWAHYHTSIDQTSPIRHEAGPDQNGARNCEIIKSWPGRRLVPVYEKLSCVTVVPYYGAKDYN